MRPKHDLITRLMMSQLLWKNHEVYYLYISLRFSPRSNFRILFYLSPDHIRSYSPCLTLALKVQFEKLSLAPGSDLCFPELTWPSSQRLLLHDLLPSLRLLCLVFYFSANLFHAPKCSSYT